MMQISLPLPPNRANARGHWITHAREKKAYVESCRPHLYRIPNVSGPVRISMHFYVWNLNDWDNLISRGKWAWDALTHYGIIEDDSPKFVALGDVKQTIDRQRQRLIIKLEKYEP